MNVDCIKMIALEVNHFQLLFGANKVDEASRVDRESPQSEEEIDLHPCHLSLK